MEFSHSGQMFQLAIYPIDGIPRATGIILEAARLAAKLGHKFPRETAMDAHSDFLSGLQQMIDAMEPHVAVLDGHGYPLLVNSHWKSADPTGDEKSPIGQPMPYSLGSGWQYLSAGDMSAIAKGIEDICSGRSRWFQHAYWHKRPQGRTPEFLTISPFLHAGKNLYLICHYDMSDLEGGEIESRDWNMALLAAQADERRRIARELHDDTAQNLLQIDFHLMNLEHRSRSRNAAAYASIRQSLHRVFEEIRTLSYFLHPPEIEGQDLFHALEVLGTGVSSRTGVSFRFDRCERQLAVAADVRLVLYRVAQEAFANAHKHGRATEVIFRLFDRGDLLILEIEDDGVGFATNPNGNLAPVTLGVGLSSMRERLEAVGGGMHIRHLDQGTTIVAFVPGQHLPGQSGSGYGACQNTNLV